MLELAAETKRLGGACSPSTVAARSLPFGAEGDRFTAWWHPASGRPDVPETRRSADNVQRRIGA